jgi:hypothetical protein
MEMVNDEFVLPATYEIRVRRGKDDPGQIWLEQVSGMISAPCDSIIVHRSQVDDLIAALQALMDKP